MASENHHHEPAQEETNGQSVATADLISFDHHQSAEVSELNQRIKTDVVDHCLSFVKDDEEARLYLQRVWKKYLRCVGDAALVNSSSVTSLDRFRCFSCRRSSTHFQRT